MREMCFTVGVRNLSETILAVKYSYSNRRRYITYAVRIHCRTFMNAALIRNKGGPDVFRCVPRGRGMVSERGVGREGLRCL